MTRIVTPIRFVAGVLGLWVAGRIVVLLPGAVLLSAWADPVERRAVAAEPPTLPRGAAPAHGAPWRNRGGEPERIAARPLTLAGNKREGGNSAPAASGGKAADAIAAGGPAPIARDGAVGIPGVLVAAQTSVLSSTGLVVPPAATAPPASRWSGDFYLFQRGEGGAPALAAGGQLGGSQAGARIAYRLNAAGPTRLAAAVRLSSPLDDRRGTEAAIGLDWHPLPGAPLRFSIERRAGLGGRGRNAWSAYAAGGFWRELGSGVLLDGYAQAGIVGARQRDPFADGALRGGYRRALGGARSLTDGAGAWGAAQPRVERLDLGPRVALGLPLAGTSFTAAAEWRVRVAGQASPRSGLALTLASDF